MSVAIRMRREGSKNNPYYRIIVTDKRNPRDGGRFLEQVGTYDPKLKTGGAKLKVDRVEHWMKQGAQPSETVASMLKKARRTAKA